MEAIQIKGPLKGDIEVPGDKSITHRAIILSALAKGQATIYKPLLGEDCLRTKAIFELLGVDISIESDKMFIDSKGYTSFTTPHQVLYTGNSGTTTRLLAGLFAGLGIQAVLSGDASIGKRPMDRIMKPLLQMGARIRGVDDNYTPLIIDTSDIKGIDYRMPVASAQVKSAILLASLFSEDETTIHELALTRNHTETMFRHYNIPLNIDGNEIQTVSRGIDHIQQRDFYVPGDISSAAFFIVAALITQGSDITLHNVGMNHTRTGIIDIVKQMGGRIDIFNVSEGAEPTASIRVQYTENLKPVSIEGNIIPRCIDEIPIIALLCSQATGKSMIKDAGELKVKETNRIDTTVNELNKLGFDLTSTDDGMIIMPSTITQVANVDSHTDHRIGMMLAIASLLTPSTIHIDRFDSVNVSFPGFLSKLKQLENEG